MSRRFPWYKFEPLEHLAATADLSLEAEGALIRMKNFQWLNGPLPKSSDEIAKIIRAKRRHRPMIDDILARFFRLTDAGYEHPELAEKMAEAAAKSEKRAAAGKEGAAARWDDKPMANAIEPNDEHTAGGDGNCHSSKMANSISRASNSNSSSPKEGSTATYNHGTVGHEDRVLPKAARGSR
ncbi:MAG: DUF1376 domain-containing protein [Gammaproteobacteria bacterium]|nr:DUF1376 domain-containing protein [Gammaproteobacteria bacterium]